MDERKDQNTSSTPKTYTKLSMDSTIGEFRNKFRENEDFQAHCRMLWNLNAEDIKNDDGHPVKLNWISETARVLLFLMGAIEKNNRPKWVPQLSNWFSTIYNNSDKIKAYYQDKQPKLYEDLSNKEKKIISQGHIQPLNDLVASFYADLRNTYSKKTETEITIQQLFDTLTQKKQGGNYAYPLFIPHADAELLFLTTLEAILTPTSMEQAVSLIETGESRQIIFTGAPGTGKTRIAKEVAQYFYETNRAGALPSPSGKEELPYWQIQFHPSYDYTDFVEGLRPIKVDSTKNAKDNMFFGKIDGQFKAFCRKVVEKNAEQEKTLKKEAKPRAKALIAALSDEKWTEAVEAQKQRLLYAIKSQNTDPAELIGAITDTLYSFNFEALTKHLNSLLSPLAKQEQESITEFYNMLFTDKQVNNSNYAKSAGWQKMLDIMRGILCPNGQLVDMLSAEKIDTAEKCLKQIKEDDGKNYGGHAKTRANTLLLSLETIKQLKPTLDLLPDNQSFRNKFDELAEMIAIASFKQDAESLVKTMGKDEEESPLLTDLSNTLAMRLSRTLLTELSAAQTEDALYQNYQTFAQNLADHLYDETVQPAMETLANSLEEFFALNSTLNIVRSEEFLDDDGNLLFDQNRANQWLQALGISETEAPVELKTNLQTHQEPLQAACFKSFQSAIANLETSMPEASSDAYSIKTALNPANDFINSIPASTVDKDQAEQKLYFFIIDEINRANLSKVFGELMYGLEKDKRGKKHAVQTQYQNLRTYQTTGTLLPDDVFADDFYIPRNVVVIGTMNDIDRSVDTMDFALRRRFDWVDFKVTAESLMQAFKHEQYGPIINEHANILAKHIMNLNNLLTSDTYAHFNLSRQYYISQGQFANLPKAYTHGTISKDSDLDLLPILNYVWEYRLESLLREYLRGQEDQDIEKFIRAAKTTLKTPIKTTSAANK